MYWRLPHARFEKQKGTANRTALRRLAYENSQLGLLAFAGDEPIGWCALAPRRDFVRLQTSRVLAAIDEVEVWSIPCLFIRKDQRRKGLSVQLLKAAARYVAAQGGRILEGYPVEPRSGEMPDAFAWTGTAAAFRQAGFEECERRSPTRPIFRRNCAGRRNG